MYNQLCIYIRIGNIVFVYHNNALFHPIYRKLQNRVKEVKMQMLKYFVSASLTMCYYSQRKNIISSFIFHQYHIHNDQDYCRLVLHLRRWFLEHSIYAGEMFILGKQSLRLVKMSINADSGKEQSLRSN